MYQAKKGKHHLYVDGEYVGYKRKGRNKYSVNNASLVLGRSHRLGDRYNSPYEGEMDSVRVYDWAIGKNTVAHLYDSGEEGNGWWFNGSVSYEFEGGGEEWDGSEESDLSKIGRREDRADRGGIYR